MRSLVAPALAGALALAQAAPSETPTLGERLRWNARERTAAGVDALAAGDAAGAVAAFDRAHRLRPDDPRTAFNAGTARVPAVAAEAVPLLEEAARQAGPELAPAAWYNLGTAKLAAGDVGGAVEALSEALRRAPDDADAKHNLELALKAAEQQRQQATQGDGGEGSNEPQPGQPGRDAGDDGPSEGSSTPSDGEPDRDGESEAPRDGTSGDPTAPGEPRSGERPLPQFHDLPDMTAEQAAAILRAVEDLERQQRRERARRAAAERAEVEVDW